jgi:hypothetical protein
MINSRFEALKPVELIPLDFPQVLHLDHGGKSRELVEVEETIEQYFTASLGIGSPPSPK